MITVIIASVTTIGSILDAREETEPIKYAGYFPRRFSWPTNCRESIRIKEIISKTHWISRANAHEV